MPGLDCKLPSQESLDGRFRNRATSQDARVLDELSGREAEDPQQKGNTHGALCDAALGSTWKHRLPDQMPAAPGPLC